MLSCWKKRVLSGTRRTSIVDEAGTSVGRGGVFRFCGESLVADPSGALYWPGQSLLAIADLHFEKSTAYADAGRFLPPYDTRATLDRLEAAIAFHRPQTVVALGDSFHDGTAEARLAVPELDRLNMLAERVSLIWILGNHDPEAPALLGGLALPRLVQGPFTFVHEAQAGAPLGEISGHFHPKAAVRRHGRTVVRPCFATDGKRLILPAFGAYTGGLDVLDPDIRMLLREPFTVLMTGGERVYVLASDRLKRRSYA